jgi:hypothetical protein
MRLSITNKTTKSISIILSLTLFFSCSFTATYNNRVEDKNEAQKVADKFYTLLKAGKYDDTYKLLSKKFFQDSDTSELNKMYHIIFQKLGAIKSDSVAHWETHVITGTNSSSVYVLYYLVEREKYESKETVSLSKENDTIKIDGYHVNSDGLYISDSTK